MKKQKKRIKISLLLEQAADLFLYVLSHIPLFYFLSSIGSSKTKKKHIAALSDFMFLHGFQEEK